MPPNNLKRKKGKAAEAPKPKRGRKARESISLDVKHVCNGHSSKEHESVTITVQKPANARDESEFYLISNGENLMLRPEEGEEGKATLKITDFQLYCIEDPEKSDGFLVPPDAIHSTEGKRFFICGTAVKYCSEANNIIMEESIEVADIELVDPVWIVGFGNEDYITVGVTSEAFDIYLMAPHLAYQKLFTDYKQKCLLAKVVADYLMEKRGEEVDFEELSEHIQVLEESEGMEGVSMDDLDRHIEFVSGHLVDFDLARDDDEPSILANECVEHLAKLYPNAKFQRKTKGKTVSVRRGRKEKTVKREQAEVPITPMVATVFPEYTKDFVKDKSVVSPLGENLDPMFYQSETQRRAKEPKEVKISILSETSVKIGQQVYHVGDGVLLKSSTVKGSKKCKESESESEEDEDEEEYDESVYTEKYRKIGKRKTEKPVAKPFSIGRIIGFEKDKKSKSVSASVRMFYRPKDTSMKKAEAREQDLNLVFFGTETKNIAVTSFHQQCAILPKKEIEKRMTLEQYFSDGENRFYYNQMFTKRTKTFQKPYSSEDEKDAVARIDQILAETGFSAVSRPLRTMDLFSGCGGLSEGLHQSGLTESRWAVEIDPHAAEAFRLNNPKASVLEDDINTLLKEVIDNDPKARLPNPESGEVEVIVGGPPCQGFSGMNRFNQGEVSKQKNSLMVSFVCAVELYHPNLVILENVKTLQASNNKTYLHRVLDCLDLLGYDFKFDILQSGNYGIPQSRNRLILIAVKKGLPMPEFPKPTHSFGNISGPLRNLTVGDAILDLEDCQCAEETSYMGKPLSQYQRMLRNTSKKLRDHVTKKLSALNQARIDHIPARRGADWRDLPNIKIPELNIIVLKYKNKQKHVCECQSQKGKKCGERKPDGDTLIPWCLPHTGDRHNNWANLFGRLDFDSQFSTTVTALEPMGKQGKVIHPLLNRLITVREAARSQGFRDTYIFSGRIMFKLCQIGNAVPPPLAYALGRQIGRAFSRIQW